MSDYGVGSSALNAIERAAQGRSVKDAADYEQDGILICGKCNAPKQAWVRWLPDENGNQQSRLVPVMCKCELDEDAREQADMRRNRFEMRLRDARSDIGATMTSGAFSGDDGSNAPVRTLCERYVDRFDEMRNDNMGILLYGSNGTGKSFFASCIVNALAERSVVTAFVTSAALVGVLSDQRERDAAIDAISGIGLLCIDDLGSERESSYASELLYTAIDARYRAKKPTIVTTNFDLAKMATTDNVWQKRIFERVTEMCPITVRMDGESKRKAIADERRNKAREILRNAAVKDNAD